MCNQCNMRQVQLVCHHRQNKTLVRGDVSKKTTEIGMTTHNLRREVSTLLGHSREGSLTMSTGSVCSSENKTQQHCYISKNRYEANKLICRKRSELSTVNQGMLQVDMGTPEEKLSRGNPAL
jgi:hypothetical protein